MQALASNGDRKSSRFWFGQKLARFSSAGRLTHVQTAILLTLTFWVSTYCLFSIRSVLFPPIGPDLVSSKRLLTTFFGGLLFFIALAGTTRFSKQGKGSNYFLIIASTIAASTVLLLFRLVYNDLAEPDTFGLTDHARWVLVWGGYFLGGLALFSPDTSAAALKPPAALESGDEQETADVIWVQGNKRLIKLPVDRIEWIEAQGNYVYAHAVEASGLLRASLSSLEEKLHAHGFIRVHRSALCQKRHIQALRRTSGGALVVILASGAELPVGRRYAANVTVIMST